MITSRRSRVPSRRSWRAMATIIAAMFFMSIAPRPHRHPSASAPENGGCFHCDASASTTSRCAVSRRGGALPSPRSRAITLVRSGACSSSVEAMSTSASLPATYSAAARSAPGGLVVSMRSRSCRNVCASRAITDGVPAGERDPDDDDAGPAGGVAMAAAYHRPRVGLVASRRGYFSASVVSPFTSR
jgi:hypothetical protein